ncbi:hypothetical protein DENSPDRAFT_597538 [Dentipellis sp. KUC8613]|nr:hypothetical protein DENSPDRAFT_597538 [Dentipellis sp. KUC8613]
MPQPALPPSTSSSSAVHTQTPQSQDAVLQAAFQQLMHSPSQMQRFMQALSSTQGFPQTPLPPPAYPPPLQQQQQYSQIAPYDPPEDYSSMLPPDSVASAQALLPKVDDGPPLSPLMDSSARLQKSYKDSSEIDADVDALQASINSLIEGMGMDPGTLSAAQPSSQMLPSSSLDMSADTELAPEDAQAADFDLDAFLTQFASGPGAGAADADITGGGGVHDADGNVDRMHAFMDEVASDPSTPATHGSPDTHGRPSAKSQAQAVAAAATHRKRKSDVAELAQELPLSTPEPAPPQSQPPRAKRAKK